MGNVWDTLQSCGFRIMSGVQKFKNFAKEKKKHEEQLKFAKPAKSVKSVCNIHYDMNHGVYGVVKLSCSALRYVFKLAFDSLGMEKYLFQDWVIEMPMERHWFVNLKA